MNTFVFIMTMALVYGFLLSNVHAMSGSSSSSTAAEVSVLNTTDPCGQQEFTNGCWYPVTCQTCLQREGCAIEIATGDCVSAALKAATTGYYLSGEVEYCSAADEACISCRKPNASESCIGANSCVCVAKCEHLSPRPTRCLGGVVSISTSTLLIGGAILLPLMLYLVLKGRPCRINVFQLLRRRQRAQNGRNLPGNLKLETWWQHVKQQTEPAEAAADLELRSCFVPMESARQLEQPAQLNQVGGDAHVEATILSAVAATDLSTGSPAADEQREASSASHVV